VKEEVVEEKKPSQNISFTPNSNVKRAEKPMMGRQPQQGFQPRTNTAPGQKPAFGQKPFGQRPQQGGAKPFGQQPQGGKPMQKPAGARPFRPVKEEPDTLVVKQERSFGNKNKTKTTK
jgi:hypothetical protein